MDKIYIFGHKKPDTDSVTSSIALSYLKNKLGYITEPRVLGSINNETKFVLDYFNFPCPKYLNDVKLQIQDLNYQKDCFLSKGDSIHKGFYYMAKHNISSLPIVDDDHKLAGLVSMKGIAKEQMSNHWAKIRTSYANIIETLHGNEIIKYDHEINGDAIIASYRSTTFIENVELDENSILIVGDRHSIIEFAVENKVKLIILTGNSELKESHYLIAKENNVNIISTGLDTFGTARKLGLSNYLDTIMFKDGIITISDTDEVSDFQIIAQRDKYSYYPVLSKNKACLGVLRLADMNDKKRKKVILVDHNHKDQSVDGLDEADIIEIIDHHNIGNLGTSIPINFRNMPVGSTCTIITMLYQENGIPIPKNIAGLLLSGIVSDTLMLKSPTTTDKDTAAIKLLSHIAEIDYQAYGMELFKAGSSLKGKTKEEILYNDFKTFTMDGKKIGIGQIFTMNIDEIQKDADEFITLINHVAVTNDYYIVALFVTDIIKNGSYVYYNQKATDVFDNCFITKIEQQGAYIPDCVSRKKQIIPNIMAVIDPK